MSEAAPPKFGVVPVGIDEIDRQHNRLLSCFDRLELWMERGHGTAAVFDAITSLNDYAGIHFRYEEAWLRRKGYPRLDAHCEEHRAIVEGLERLTERLGEGEDIGDETLRTLRDWIVRHINDTDAEYARYLHDGTGG